MQKIDTDKFSHGYIEVYDPLFKKLTSPKKILEIGVYQGGSLRLLQSYFPNTNIYGLDLGYSEECKQDGDNFSILIGNQENRDDLLSVVNTIDGELDLIIDDGGHTMEQQQVSFGYLFQFVKPGGYYILEDLHTSRFGLESVFITPTDLITTLDLLYNFKNTNKIISNHMLDNEIKHLEDNIESIEIWSRNIEHNISVTSIIRKRG